MNTHFNTLSAKLCAAGCLLVLMAACQTKPASFSSPQGYDFTAPVRFVLPQKLAEVSGIVVLPGTADSLLAIEDETGHLYRLAFGNTAYTRAKFAGSDDYEDLTLLPNGSVVVLNSRGKLLQIPPSGQRDSVLTYKPPLPLGEYEALSAKGNELYTMCKQCPGKGLSVFILQMPATPTAPLFLDSVKVALDALPKKMQKQLANLGASAMAAHPTTGEWFVLSSVKKLLLVLGSDFTVKTVHDLDPATFKQPEGLAFNAVGELFISNEGGSGSSNILRFAYQPK